MRYDAIVIGLSSGGMEAMKMLFPALPEDFNIPIIIVQHVSPQSDSQWISILNKNCRIEIKEAVEKEKIRPGHIYIAPPNYHLLIEKDHTFSISIDERVSYARPSIDVLFDTAAEAFRDRLVGVVLTGSNHDGAKGLKKIKYCGGLCIAQNPESAFSAYMPQIAIATAEPQHILDLENIITLLISLNTRNPQI